MRHRFYAALAAALFVLAASPLPSEGASMASKVAKALRIAKKADRKATKALTAKPLTTQGTPGTQGPKGDPGPSGPQGIQGPSGSNGQPGTNGRDGTDGATGPQGEQGPQGLPGQANLAMASESNASASPIGTQANVTAATHIASVQINKASAGTVFVLAEGQMVESFGAPSPVACWITDADGSERDRREFTAPASAKTLITVSSAFGVSAGQQTLRFTCRRLSGATDATLTFPTGRARISVMHG